MESSYDGLTRISDRKADTAVQIRLCFYPAALAKYQAVDAPLGLPTAATDYYPLNDDMFMLIKANISYKCEKAHIDDSGSLVHFEMKISNIRTHSYCRFLKLIKRLTETDCLQQKTFSPPSQYIPTVDKSPKVW